ncbi:TonB family protein [Brevundimonas sp. 2R-24]|uniref:TonB family protein n=1 Tax=Peiella sedimenti TaxID=3061083 RepID=A0ABT8SKX2_9CAUL|nr:TonB family protein [Caulobacteraceae bacterium XZ-24]
MFVTAALAVALLAQEPTAVDTGEPEGFPAEALRRNIRSGSVTLRCRVIHDGSAQHCEVIEESPAGMGFGEAALRAAAQFRFRSERGGPGSGAVVTIPLRFEAPEAPEAPEAGAR